MAVPARIKTWVADETVSASDLNAEFNIAIGALADGTKDANISALTTATATVTGASTFNGTATHEGALVANSTVTLGNARSDAVNIVGNTTADLILFAGLAQPGWTNNLGLSYASGVLKLTDREGGTLSNTNPGYICLPSTTAGQHVILKCNANVTIQDDSNATSHFTLFEAGVTSTANWAEDVPWFLYVVNRGNTNVDGTDNNSAIFISRNPAMYTTPSAQGNIGSKGGIPATDDQTSILLFGTYTVANYVSLPCQIIGAVRMRYATATNDWTVQALGNSDGIGKTQLEKTFSRMWTFPTGQMGASASTHLLPNGQVASVFSTAAMLFKLGPDGVMHLWCDMNGDGGADGSSGSGTGTDSNLRVAIPYAHALANQTATTVGCARIIGSVVGTVTTLIRLNASGVSYLEFIQPDGTPVDNEGFGSGGRSIEFFTQIPVF